mmetsp:Transcript_39171/g.77537  ORF Transcript_39171/g.77537 Transcript_39171/m.77537 type:complete len:125 (-) Transcript_39171:1190-1564(-)
MNARGLMICVEDAGHLVAASGQTNHQTVEEFSASVITVHALAVHPALRATASCRRRGENANPGGWQANVVNGEEEGIDEHQACHDGGGGDRAAEWSGAKGGAAKTLKTAHTKGVSGEDSKGRPT